MSQPSRMSRHRRNPAAIDSRRPARMRSTSTRSSAEVRRIRAVALAAHAISAFAAEHRAELRQGPVARSAPGAAPRARAAEAERLQERYACETPAYAGSPGGMDVCAAVTPPAEDGQVDPVTGSGKLMANQPTTELATGVPCERIEQSATRILVIVASARHVLLGPSCHRPALAPAELPDPHDCRAQPAIGNLASRAATCTGPLLGHTLQSCGTSSLISWARCVDC